MYIDIPLKELDEQPPHFNSTISKTLHTKEEFKKYYDFLLQCQTAYAKKNHTDYILFKNDDQFKQYKSWFLTRKFCIRIELSLNRFVPLTHVLKAM